MVCSCTTSGALRRGEDRFPAARQYEKEDINGIFPDAVYIKTRTQTFNTYHYYILYQGLIWYKSIDSNSNGNAGNDGAEPQNWALFQKTGLPRNPLQFGFHKPKRIVEIAADADELVALSDEGGFYRYCFDRSIAHKSNVWLDKQGWPVADPLYLDRDVARNSAWAMGKRNSHVLYYEDPFGNQHHNGTMEIATTYMLLEDGQEIRYADTGLRSDFSRNFIGPERGAFKAVALSASASTLFVMNDAGEMYTRIVDFDIAGCDPMLFKYTYVPYTSDVPGTSYFSNLTEWGLPSEDWRAQPRIPRDGKAAVTRHITILQTGQGNGARELRVAGFDEAGNRGYWSKGIFDESWRFVVAPLYFPFGSVLKNTGGTGERGQTLDAAFSGSRWIGTEREEDVLYEIPNFNILEGDCALRITRGEETFALTLHPIELWTYLKRDFMPGRTGLPKMFMATVIYDENGLETGEIGGLSEEFAAYIRERFGKNNRKPFQYTMAAGSQFCLLRGGGDPDSVIFLTDGSLPDDFAEFNAAWYLLYIDEIARYHSPELMIENTALAPEPVPEPVSQAIRHKIALNKNLREKIKAELRALEDDKALSLGMNIGYFPLDATIRYSPLRFVNVPKFRTIIGFGKEIILQNNAYIDRFVESQAWAHQKNIELLDLRIAAYTEAAKRAEKEGGSAAFPPWFAEHVTGYWDIAGLPRTVQGSFFSPASRDRATPPVTLAFVPPQNEQSVFGWYLAAGSSCTLFIDPQDSLKTIYRRKGKTPQDRTLTLDCVIYTDSTGKSGTENNTVAHYLESFAADSRNSIKAQIMFDGETFEIREHPAVHNNNVIFRSAPAGGPAGGENPAGFSSLCESVPVLAERSAGFSSLLLSHPQFWSK
jgi:hypothetical protein